MSAVLPWKESSLELVVEVVRALEPYFPEITFRWRDAVRQEFGFDGRTLAALERLTAATASSYLSHGDQAGHLENLAYWGTRLSKLQVDIRAVARCLDLFQIQSDSYLSPVFGDRDVEAKAALEVLMSGTFIAVSGAYFDTQTREQSMLLSVLDAELHSEDLNELLRSILETTAKGFNASIGLLLLRQPEAENLTDILDEEVTHQGSLRVEAAVQLEDLSADAALGDVRDLAWLIASTGEPQLVLDANRDDRVLSKVLKERAISYWGVPLKVEGQSIGVMLLGFPKPYEWLLSEKELMRAIADRSALAIERAQMTEALREREARIVELSAHLLRVQEDERKRISRELHDETGQALMVIRLYLGMLEKLMSERGESPRASASNTQAAKDKISETVEVVDRTIDGIRRIIRKLSPLVLQELGLTAAIRKEAKDLQRNNGVKTRVMIPEDVGRLPQHVEAAVYRIVQEALHNVAKHAKATSVTVQVARQEDSVRLVVQDDGVGIAPKRGHKPGNSFGLAGIQERVSMLGGSARVTSGIHQGTRIEVLVPVTEDGTSQPWPPTQAQHEPKLTG